MNSYKVLARKYRPLNFEELVGQKYTKQTLINSLNNNIIHHGFLFTGIHGIGKTTIARILAKSLNCEQGISAKPCGKCSSCLSIDKSQSIDVIELDAASNTQVDKMRDLLEDAKYSPNKSRFKIYIIDEVHMLSISSFNAMLKTLEEPPKHIKFIFATTNPQKLPITILSRCLQFNLQKITVNEILEQLKQIMQTEKIKFTEEALLRIAEFANGSMRDSLSLLDQSISFSNNNVNLEIINKMLGVVAKDNIFEIIDAIFVKDAKLVIKLIDKNAQNGINLAKILNNIASILHDIANYKLSNIGNDNIKKLSKLIDNKEIQIYYQIILNGLKDLQFAPNDEIGVKMTLLRVISFDFIKKKL